jgi:Zn-finger nucleic acid-binding protein
VKCPGCRYALIVLEIEEVEIDHCLACGGVWLDAGELELLLATSANKNELMATLAADVEGKERSIRCPICSKKLDKILVGKDREVRLDKCPEDHGLWFDQGELLDVLRMGVFSPDDRVYRLLHEVFGSKSHA